MRTNVEHIGPVSDQGIAQQGRYGWRSCVRYSSVAWMMGDSMAEHHEREILAAHGVKFDGSGVITTSGTRIAADKIESTAYLSVVPSAARKAKIWFNICLVILALHAVQYVFLTQYLTFLSIIVIVLCGYGAFRNAQVIKSTPLQQVVYVTTAGNTYEVFITEDVQSGEAVKTALDEALRHNRSSVAPS